MKIAYITAGAAGMYCGTCMQDNSLATALMADGHEVSLLPTYTPTRTDESNVADEHIFFGALNVYLQQNMGFFRRHRIMDRLLDNRRLLRWVGKMAGKASTDAKDLGAMTLSMLEGEKGHQARELDKLVEFLADIVQPDVVHLSTTLFAGFARQIQQDLGIPVVCALQGEDIFFEDLIEPHKSQVEKEVLERCAEIPAFTAPSRYYADFMAERYGIPRDRIHVTRLSIDSGDLVEASKIKPPHDDTLVIGYLARQCPEKGLHHLVDAFEILARDYPAERLKLRVAGYLGVKDQDFVDGLQQKVAGSAIRDQVDWVGEVDRQGKIDFLSSLDVFSVPTVYHEPKGRFVPESLAVGVPVVLPRHGAFPEWVEQTDGGKLFEPENPVSLAAALKELLDRPEERHRLAEAGQQAVQQRFRPEQMAEDNLAVYRQVLGPATPTAGAGAGSNTETAGPVPAAQTESQGAVVAQI